MPLILLINPLLTYHTKHLVSHFCILPGKGTGKGNIRLCERCTKDGMLRIPVEKRWKDFALNIESLMWTRIGAGLLYRF